MSSIIIAGFLIDDENEDKFAQHSLRFETVLQVLENPNIRFPNRRQVKHRATYILIGRDNGGAPITVPIEPTPDPEFWRPVTAWPSGKWEQAELDRRGI